MRMPIYEFTCERCGARFEGLVPAGTYSIACPECGAGETVRVLSAPGAPMNLVKSAGARRAQERQNAKLRTGAKARFKAARRCARERSGGGGPPAGAA
jgi:putative FmdB family regulatory protein